MEADPDAYLDAVLPDVPRMRALHLDRSRDGVPGAREGEKRRRRPASHLGPVRSRECLADEPAMLAQHVAVPLSELLEQPGRVLDVGEDERDGPARDGGHARHRTPRANGRRLCREWFSVASLSTRTISSRCTSASTPRRSADRFTGRLTCLRGVLTVPKLKTHSQIDCEARSLIYSLSPQLRCYRVNDRGARCYPNGWLVFRFARKRIATASFAVRSEQPNPARRSRTSRP